MVESTNENLKIANSIVDVLAEKECTIEQAQSILSYVSRIITTNSTVQKTNLSNSNFNYITIGGERQSQHPVK